MRILFLTAIAGKQGTWFRCANLGKQLSVLGHDVTLIKVGSQRFLPRVSVEAGMRVIDSPQFFGTRFSRMHTRLPTDFLVRADLLLREQFDVVHAFQHFANVAIPGALIRYLSRTPPLLVVDWDDLWSDGGLMVKPGWSEPANRINYLIEAQSERLFKTLGDAVTVVSDDLIQRSVTHGVPRESLHLIPNGSPVDAFRPMPMAEARARLSLPAEPKILLFSGFTGWDIALILDAMLLLGPELKFLAVFTGPGRESTLRVAAERGMSEKVRVDGLVPIENVPIYMSAADVGLIPFSDRPCNRARWPIKLGDYLAAGLPVATNDVGEMGRFVRQWNVGVSTPCNAQAYADGITMLLRSDMTALRTRAREVAEINSWHAAARSLEQVYVDALRGRAAQGKAS